ncbi:MAG TPA: ABC transporter ATP-binding protein [Pseudonocardiaceae bacterium]|nr:ABC transporter ATP-binding protein [Pseudonocardiaceae bacterium]
MTAALELDGVRKRFGQVLVADGLSLAVEDGQLLGIVGPNGAGKTTLFGMISGDVSPDAGEIRVGGRPITSIGPAARTRMGIGRTYQVPRPFEHMSVFENVLTGAVHGARLGKAESRETALEVLELTGLLPVANRQAGRLTLLARKRLEVARALATRPTVLLLDEVAGGLTDPEVDQLLEIVGTLRQRGLTVLWIEHVVHALLRSVDRLVCLASGTLVADGAPAAVMADPTVRKVYLGADVRTVAS